MKSPAGNLKQEEGEAGEMYDLRYIAERVYLIHRIKYFEALIEQLRIELSDVRAALANFLSCVQIPGSDKPEMPVDVRLAQTAKIVFVALLQVLGVGAFYVLLRGSGQEPFFTSPGLSLLYACCQGLLLFAGCKIVPSLIPSLTVQRGVYLFIGGIGVGAIIFGVTANSHIYAPVSGELDLEATLSLAGSGDTGATGEAGFWTRLWNDLSRPYVILAQLIAEAAFSSCLMFSHTTTAQAYRNMVARDTKECRGFVEAAKEIEKKQGDARLELGKAEGRLAEIDAGRPVFVARINGRVRSLREISRILDDSGSLEMKSQTSQFITTKQQ